MDKKYTAEEIINSTLAFSYILRIFEEMINVYDEIIANEEVCSIINREIHMPQPSGKDVDLPYKVILVIFIDLVKCYHNMGHEINFDNRDAYLLPMTLNIKFRYDMLTDIEFKHFISLDEVKHLYINILKSVETWAKQDGPGFIFTRFAKTVDAEICNKYINLMINSSGYIKSSNPTNIRMEYKWTSDLKQIKF